MRTANTDRPDLCTELQLALPAWYHQSSDTVLSMYQLSVPATANCRVRSTGTYDQELLGHLADFALQTPLAVNHICKDNCTQKVSIFSICLLH